MEQKNKTVQAVGLIGDVGATYARFALLTDDSPGVSLPVISEIQVFQLKDYPSIECLISHYLFGTGLSITPKKGCIAVPGVVDGDSVYLPNLDWRFSSNRVRADLGFETLLFVNDFLAQAWGIREIDLKNLVKIGGGEKVAEAPIVVVGPGSGLGVAGGIPSGRDLIVVSSEGGHAGFAPRDALEIEIFQYLLKIFGRVSNERVLSGPGIENLYQAILHLHDVKKERLTAPEITEKALSGVCRFCLESLQLFCAILGGVSGDLALVMGARGGVYITGGIVPRFVEFLKTSGFRKRFEDKGRFEPYLKQIPVFVVTADYPGLSGARAVFKAKLS